VEAHAAYRVGRSAVESGIVRSVESRNDLGQVAGAFDPSLVSASPVTAWIDMPTD